MYETLLYIHTFSKILHGFHHIFGILNLLLSKGTLSSWILGGFKLGSINQSIQSSNQNLQKRIVLYGIRPR